jgi:hypothetical protein
VIDLSCYFCGRGLIPADLISFYVDGEGVASCKSCFAYYVDYEGDIIV